MERRAFLRRLATVPVLGLAVRGDVSDYTDSSRVLEDLAEEIDQTDLTHADEVFHLSNSVRRALQDAEAGINTSETERARTVASIKHSIAEILAIIPGVDSPPEQPRIETEIDAIESAASYYRTLQTYLRHSGDLYIDISRFEADVSDPTGEPSLPDEDLISRGDDAVVRVKSEGERLQNGGASPVQSLLPDTERVTNLSEELMENYEIYVTAQQSYSTTTEYITEGAQSREQGGFDDAEIHFRHAKDHPTIDFPESRREYSLDEKSLTLDEYETVISLTQRGARKMRESCDSPGTKQSRESFKEGLNDVIAARGVFSTQ
ncbi:hypothetical protein RH858_02460 [Halalkaliarchaeum sp. AArc-GB]|uniref:hypothetical protein n=1 Tax=Halalkaliarchaeum sp. AArc-GB TaxID=3074078 RepID=UPI0028649B3E|nr:hypothetical protein [Halalkaliarchaeum sp. AArc-GB]MDR5672019.1 hypothetical protein [Halalkaliarchaeum sp. AArc-GB]